MGYSSQFMIAVHATALLAYMRERWPVCSDVIARSVNTNPVVIRRVMRKLARAGIVEAASGRNGGFMLAREAGAITLADIANAVQAEDEREFFGSHPNSPNACCPVGAHITNAVRAPLERAALALDCALRETTLSDIEAKLPREA
jgi:Rrf2 family protein